MAPRAGILTRAFRAGTRDSRDVGRERSRAERRAAREAVPLPAVWSALRRDRTRQYTRHLAAYLSAVQYVTMLPARVARPARPVTVLVLLYSYYDLALISVIHDNFTGVTSTFTSAIRLQGRG